MLLTPPDAPLLAEALEAVARRDPGAGEGLARAVAADEEVWLPTSADGRHPLASDDGDGVAFMTAHTGAVPALWAHPWRPPMDRRPVREVLGLVVASGRAVHLDHASEADTALGPAEAEALLAGRGVDADRAAAGDPFRRPGPPAAPPPGVLPPPGPGPDDDRPVTFGRAWDGATRTVVEAGEGPVAARERAGGREVVVTGPAQVVALRYADGEVHRWTWTRFAEGLFLAETATAADLGGTRSRPRIVTLARPDGVLRVWSGDPDGPWEMSTRSTPDMRGRWIGVPPPGVIDPLLDAG